VGGGVGWGGGGGGARGGGARPHPPTPQTPNPQSPIPIFYINMNKKILFLNLIKVNIIILNYFQYIYSEKY